MLRSPDKPEMSWEDYQLEVEQNLDRPFYAVGTTKQEQQTNAQVRCAEIGREAKEHSDCAGGYYYTCEEMED
jgi:hypothetical protein